MIITWRTPGRAACASTPAANVARFGATFAAGSGGGGSTGPGIWLASVRPDAVYPVAVWPEAVRPRVR